ncbi:hypothetical protein COB21_03885 [Candidatus Aerophobetes bacterium]|uniref:histidine kinase n=1 Tax=Aerophobetes bacterium TaxID=2030807 RepID=A0A2A4X2N4_UNCAE|nr:MAG: hypothetical protein COB21_03885 [Candidatus Aerophobetes bacterium]
MKKIFPLILLFITTSLLCFYHPRMTFYSDWMLFVLLFTCTCVLVLFQKQRRERKKGKGDIQGNAFPYLNLMSEGIILFDHAGIVLAINAQAEKLFKVKRSAVIGTSLISTQPEVFWHYFSQISKIANRVITQDSTQVASFCLDHAQMQDSVDLVAKPTGERGVFAIVAKDSLQNYKLQKVGRDFIANASHELRTPITIIKGFAETIQDLPEISDGMLEDFVEKIVRNCHRMDNLVKNLLILTDLDALPKAQMQNCDIVCLMDNCAHTLLSVRPDADIEILHNHDTIMISADPDLLELALMNLLENAAKYSRRPAKISITIDKSDAGVDIVIRDEGKGIPKEDLDSIFERFYTVNKAHSRKLGGAGLGLSIVKTIINKHDAQISVYSQVDKGTTFTLSFNEAHCTVA